MKNFDSSNYRLQTKYRMLLYAIVLIVMMLATNNAEIKAFLASLNPFRRKEEA